MTSKIVMLTPLPIHLILHDRYGVLDVLRMNRWGWIYLAVDRTDADRLCVLEELIPLESSELDFLQQQLNQKLRSLIAFEHSQIPHYFDVINHADRLYLAREYIEGQSYRVLLNQRLKTGAAFSEAEIIQFLKQTLPLLRKLHQRGMIHQNLTLDSIVYRQADQIPVFVAFAQAFYPAFLEAFTWDYAPIDQQLGERIGCDTDLYALAAIAVVLLTGDDPNTLYDEKTQRWQLLTQNDPKLARVLDRMLSSTPWQRYASATKVMQALFEEDRTEFAAIVFAFVLIGLAAIAAWRLMTHLPNFRFSFAAPAWESMQPTPQTTQNAESNSVEDRTQKLGIRDEILNQLVAETDSADLSTKLATLSSDARTGMGTYRRVSYNAWAAIAKQSNVSDRALEALADARFVAMFPEQKGKTLNPRTFGQVWYAIARDQATQTKAKTVQNNSHQKGILKNAQGTVYRLPLQQNQILKLTLDASPNQVALWVFSPVNDAPALLKNSNQNQWSSKVTRSGVYEIVLAPSTIDAIEYNLQLGDDK